jgi:hypothetical protein
VQSFQDEGHIGPISTHKATFVRSALTTLSNPCELLRLKALSAHVRALAVTRPTDYYSYNMSSAVGRRVVVTGLQSNTALNGSRGVVTQGPNELGEPDQYIVHMDGVGERRFLSKNLELEEKASSVEIAKRSNAA